MTEFGFYISLGNRGAGALRHVADSLYQSVTTEVLSGQPDRDLLDTLAAVKPLAGRPLNIVEIARDEFDQPVLGLERCGCQWKLPNGETVEGTFRVGWDPSDGHVNIADFPLSELQAAYGSQWEPAGDQVGPLPDWYAEFEEAARKLVFEWDKQFGIEAGLVGYELHHRNLWEVLAALGTFDLAASRDFALVTRSDGGIEWHASNGGEYQSRNERDLLAGRERWVSTIGGLLVSVLGVSVAYFAWNQNTGGMGMFLASWAIVGSVVVALKTLHAAVTGRKSSVWKSYFRRKG